jgi:exonuclease III
LIQQHIIKLLINKDNYMTGITIYLSILTLNVNGLNSPIKRHQLVNWIKKEDPTICCLQETHLIDRNKHWLRVKGCKKIYQANSPWKQAGIAILTLDKVDFKLALIKWDKEGHSILIKGEIYQKEITIINLYTPNVNAPNFIKYTLKDLKTYINSNTVAVGDLNTPLSPIDKSSKQKINKEGIPTWWLQGGSRKRASYNDILERCWRHTLQAKPSRRGKTLTPPHFQPVQRISTSC